MFQLVAGVLQSQSYLTLLYVLKLTGGICLAVLRHGR
jgi:hypothetical protein